jgi:FkbM family methyltransferase
MSARIWNRVRRRIFPESRKISYSQCGQDLIVAFVFEELGILHPSYLDLGAYHPRRLSNTFLFYRGGSSGTCVEPNPKLLDAIRKARPRDLCVQAGIGTDGAREVDYYVMSMDTLNTFSKEEAESIARHGRTQIKGVLKIPVLSLPDLFARYHLAVPDFVSIDIEGQELPVLQSFPWTLGRPTVLCIETLTYTEDKTERKQSATIEWVRGRGYLYYADTYVNSIFVDEAAWTRR